MTAYKNIDNSGIANTVSNILDYVGPSSKNVYKLIIEEFERDTYGDRRREVRRFPITLDLGKQTTNLEMVEGGEKPLTRIHFDCKPDVDIAEGDTVEISGVVYIVDELRDIDIGDSVVMKGGYLVQRRSR